MGIETMIIGNRNVIRITQEIVEINITVYEGYIIVTSDETEPQKIYEGSTLKIRAGKLLTVPE